MPHQHPDENDLDQVNLSQIARMAGVGRAAVVNWRRRHGGLEATGGTDERPLFPRTVAEAWLHGLGEPLREPRSPRQTATVTFTGGPTLTVYGPELFSPALPGSGGADEEEFMGYIEHDRPPGIPWPTASARICLPGEEPFEVTGAHVDISGWGGRTDFLKLIWPASRRTLTPATETTEAQA